MTVLGKIFLTGMLTLSLYSLANCEGESEYKLGQKLEGKGQNLLAAQLYLNSLTGDCNPEILFDRSFSLARTLFALEESDLAFELLLEPQNQKQISQKNILLAYHYPEMKLNMPSPDRNRLEEFDKNVEIIRTEKSKSPWLAGSMSALIPGSGHFYLADYQSGALVFVLNALLFASALETQQEKLYASSMTLWTLFSITYVGSIVSSVRLANQINEKSNQSQIENLKRDLLPELFVDIRF